MDKLNNIKESDTKAGAKFAEGLYPDPEALLTRDKINLTLLKQLVGKSIISTEDFDRELVLEICRFAALLEVTNIAEYHPLDGKLIITAFFEASTRTRLSFESAVLRLDGKIMSIADGRTTGQAKGESMADIGEMFNAYGDLVIMRHTETEAVNDISQNLRVPLINAGNGSGEHPTQALADWFAILKWKPALMKDELEEEDKIHLAILGTPGKMRAVKSFVRMSLLFKKGIRKITIVSEMADPLGELRKELESSDIEFQITHDIQNDLKDFDVIYMNSIAFLGDSYKALDSRYKIDSKSQLKKDAVVLHPLARLDELSTALDKTNHNLYFTQAHGAVFIRQALLISVLDRFDRIPKDEIPAS